MLKVYIEEWEARETLVGIRGESFNNERQVDRKLERKREREGKEVIRNWGNSRKKFIYTK